MIGFIMIFSYKRIIYCLFCPGPHHVLVLFPPIHWALPIPTYLFLKSRFHIEKKEVVIVALSLAYFTAILLIHHTI